MVEHLKHLNEKDVPCPVRIKMLIPDKINSNSWLIVIACLEILGRSFYGTEAKVHSNGDGSGPDGKEPIQGEVYGAPGGSQVHGNDQGYPGRPLYQ